MYNLLHGSNITLQNGYAFSGLIFPTKCRIFQCHLLQKASHLLAENLPCNLKAVQTKLRASLSSMYTSSISENLANDVICRDDSMPNLQVRLYFINSQFLVPCLQIMNCPLTHFSSEIVIQNLWCYSVLTHPSLKLTENPRCMKMRKLLCIENKTDIEYAS